jgi:hypothetical protein
MSLSARFILVLLPIRSSSDHTSLWVGLLWAVRTTAAPGRSCFAEAKSLATLQLMRVSIEQRYEIAFSCPSRTEKIFSYSRSLEASFANQAI